MYGLEDNDFLKKQKELQQMKFELDGLKKTFNENPGIKLGSYDVTGRDNVNPNTTLGVNDFSFFSKKGSELKLGKQDFGEFQDGAEDAIGAMDVDSSAKKGFFSKDSNFLGTKGKNVAGSTIDAGMQVMNMATTTSNSEEESIMNGLNMTMKGAQAGMAIGGPWGAAIGGGAGLIYGAIDMIGDSNKRNRKERKAHKKAFKEEQAKLEQEYRIEQGKDSMEKLARVRKAQMDYLI